MPKLRVITKMPPEPHGEPEQQVAQLRDYLLQLCEELAYLLTHLESDNINDSTFQRIQEMIPRAGTNLPAMDGEASTGSMAAWARSDHRHPSDESKADVTALEETAGELADHVADIGNPHEVTAAQVGLGNVANERQYSAENPPPTPSAAAVGAIPATDKGNAGGVAELDANGLVPSAQLPSYVDDVLSYPTLADFPAIGEDGKIYLAKDTNRQYRWSGSDYMEVSKSLALGETSSTAYRGDRGKTAYDHSQLTSGNPHNVSASDVGLGNVANERQYSALNPPPLPTPADIGAATAQDLSDHVGDTANPHGVTAAQAGARPDTWMPTASDVGARPDTWTPSASDVGAQPTIAVSGILKGDGLGGVSAATAGTDYQAPLTAGTDYQTPLVAGTDYQTPLVADVDYQTPLVAGTDYQTPLAAGTDYQTPLVAGTDYQTPLVAGTDYQTPLTAGTDYATPAMIPTVPDPSDATPQALGTAAAGSSGDYSRADHVHNIPSIYDMAYTNADLSATNAGDALDEIVAGGGGGGPSPATAVPVMDGTGAVGTSLLYAREDHEHPSDTAKQDAITASGILKGDGAGNVSAAVSGTDYQAPLVAGTDYQTPLVAGTDYQTPLAAGTDYQTPLVAGTDYQTPLVAGTDYATPGMIPSVPSASSATPQALGTAAAGSSDDYSRADHVHQKPSAADIGAYVKPSVGIPSSDMASGVQTSLGKADTAYQKPSAGIPSSDMASAVQTSLGLADSAYQLPSGGIPASDLASGVIPTVPSAYTSNPAMDGTASPGSSNNYARGDHVHPTDSTKAAKSDLTSIQATGTTNTTGAAIPAGAYFYLNGVLHRAKEQIGTNVPFTVNTNCEQATVGEDLLKLDNLIAKAPGSGTRDAQLQVGTYNNVATMSFVSLPSRSPGKPDVYVDFAETYIRVYYVKSDGTTTTKTYLPS